MKKILKRIFLFFSLWFFVHLIIIMVDGYTEQDVTAEIGVILGSQVLPSGEMSDRLKARVDRGLNLYREGKVKTLLVSGGRGIEGYQEPLVMANYLEAQGVPASAILVDTFGINTYATAKAAREIYLQRDQQPDFILVSHYFHLSRCKLAFRSFGLPVQGTAYARIGWEWREPWSWLREVLGYYTYLWKDYEP
ncbi:MAG: YdcF family protein [Bacteroidota bacterium]